MRQPNFHTAGNARGLFCSTHKEPGMVNVVSKPCQHPGCTKQPSFNMPGCTQAQPPAPPPAAPLLSSNAVVGLRQAPGRLRDAAAACMVSATRSLRSWRATAHSGTARVRRRPSAAPTADAARPGHPSCARARARWPAPSSGPRARAGPVLLAAPPAGHGQREAEALRGRGLQQPPELQPCGRGPRPLLLAAQARWHGAGPRRLPSIHTEPRDAPGRGCKDRMLGSMPQPVHADV